MLRTPAAALRINLNVEGCSIVAAPVHAPSRAPFLLPSRFHTISLSPNSFVLDPAVINTHTPRSLVRDGQTSPRRPRLVVSHSTCPPLSPSPHADSFVIGTAVINIHSSRTTPHLIFLDYSLVEEDSWLHTWFRMPPASPTALALCPAVLKLLRLKFQPVLLQHPETTGENVTRYWMVGFPWPLEKVRDISIVV